MTKEMNDAELFGFFLESMTVGTSDAIRNQEKRGQQDLNRREILPKDCQGDREALERFGVVFHDDYDDLFVNVTLPEGWYKEALEGNGYWTELRDEKGRVRANIFYKAAFYDRAAHLSVQKRYRSRCIPVVGYDVYWQLNDDERQGKGAKYGVIEDVGEVIHVFEPHYPSEEIPWYKLSDVIYKEAKAWLDEHYPDHEDPAAYWD